MNLPPITKQQQAILILIYYYRFLNRIQIQAFLRHKNKKTINIWLPDLVEKQYLKRIYSRGFSENTKPAIYYIGSNGIRYVKSLGIEGSELRKRYKEDTRSDAFIQQRVLLGDIALSFTENETQHALVWWVHTEAQILMDGSKFQFLSELRPNLVLVKEKGKKAVAYLLEAFSPTLPKYSIRKRIREYVEFAESGTWEAETQNDFPTLLFVCPDKPTLIYAKRYVKKLKEENDVLNDLRLWFATQESVKAEGVMSEIWEEI